MIFYVFVYKYYFSKSFSNQQINADVRIFQRQSEEVMITKFLTQLEKKSMPSVKMMKLSTFLRYSMGLVRVMKKFIFRVVCKIMPYCGAILTTIGIPIDIPVVWGKCWLKKSVVSENRVYNVGNVFKWVLWTLVLGFLITQSRLGVIIVLSISMQASGSKGSQQRTAVWQHFIL